MSRSNLLSLEMPLSRRRAGFRRQASVYQSRRAIAFLEEHLARTRKRAVLS
jgi:hypothetical protein